MNEDRIISYLWAGPISFEIWAQRSLSRYLCEGFSNHRIRGTVVSMNVGWTHVSEVPQPHIQIGVPRRRIPRPSQSMVLFKNRSRSRHWRPRSEEFGRVCVLFLGAKIRNPFVIVLGRRGLPVAAQCNRSFSSRGSVSVRQTSAAVEGCHRFCRLGVLKSLLSPVGVAMASQSARSSWSDAESRAQGI